MSGRRWIAERRHPDPMKLADPGVDLKTLLDGYTSGIILHCESRGRERCSKLTI